MTERGRQATWLAAALIFTALAGTAHAVDGTWDGPGAEWTTGTNWSSTPTVPDGTATFTNNGAPTAVTISNTASIGTLDFTAAAPAFSFTVGNAATFTVGGTTNASAFTPGFKVSTGATLAIADGASVEIGALADGAGGGGVVSLGAADPTTFLSIASGTSTTFSGSFTGVDSLELNNTGTTLTLTGASNGGNIGTIAGDLVLCSCFAGGLTISGGSLTVLGNGFSGGVSVEGGTLAVINGATLQIGAPATPAALLVESNVLISGPGSTVTVTGGPTAIGILAQTASLVISNGGVLNSQAGAEIDALPISPTGQPSVTVTGPGSTWNVGGAGLFVGGGSTGGAATLTVANGGAVNVSGDVVVGDSFTSTSTLLVTGPGSVLNTNTLTIGGPGCGCGNLFGTVTIADGAVINSPGSMGIFAGSTLNLGNGGLAGAIVTPSIVNDGQIVANFTDALGLAADVSGSGTLSKLNAGTLILTGTNTYSGGTTINGGTLQIGNGGTTGSITGNVTDNAVLAFNRSNALSFVGVISGSGAVQQNGAGTTTLTANNTYTGGTVVNAGMLQLGPGASLAAGGALTVNGGIFNLNGNNQTVGALAGTGGAILLGSGTLTAGDASSTTLAAAISGTGGLVKQGSGTLTLTGASTFTGGTVVNAGSLVVNGSLAGSVTVNGGQLRGSGSVGTLVLSSGAVAPGNSIGTLTVNGSFVQGAGSSYQVEVNAAGQSDRINVNGVATITGATVQVLAQSGTYARNTTYTILNATGGVAGAYSGVTSNFAFLTPSLAYDANNVFLTLFLSSSAFAAGAQTPNQYAVGVALDQANPTATGDFATVLNAMSVLSTQQGPAALDAISGQPYADFGTVNVQAAALFMNAVGQQMALARGSATGGGQRQALAQACDIAACDATSPWATWVSALGGLGSVAGNGNSSTLTYNFGGVAAGVDYRLDPRFLLGLGAGYTHGTQWVNSFMGQGWSDSASVVAYGSFTQGAFYADALAGYAYSGNQQQRQILIPGLQQRTASGSTGANQFLGQVESGYKIGLYAPALATLTPFGRLQTTSVNQNAFTESGANSLSLNVAQQTTTSLRSTLGADLAGAIGLADAKTLDLALRLGWQHEYADIGRPITAAFAGAPINAFTVYGATPQRDSAVIGFSASAAVAPATQLYLRYDGQIGSGNDNHMLNVGVRMTW